MISRRWYANHEADTLTEDFPGIRKNNPPGFDTSGTSSSESDASQREDHPTANKAEQHTTIPEEPDGQATGGTEMPAPSQAD